MTPNLDCYGWGQYPMFRVWGLGFRFCCDVAQGRPCRVHRAVHLLLWTHGAWPSDIVAYSLEKQHPRLENDLHVSGLGSLRQPRPYLQARNMEHLFEMGRLSAKYFYCFYRSYFS